MYMNIFTSIYNAIVKWCCGGRADSHGEITRELAIRDYYESLKYYRELQTLMGASCPVEGYGRRSPHGDWTMVELGCWDEIKW